MNYELKILLFDKHFNNPLQFCRIRRFEDVAPFGACFFVHYFVAEIIPKGCF